MSKKYAWDQGQPKPVELPENSDFLTDVQGASYLNIGIKTYKKLGQEDPDFPKPYKLGQIKELRRRSELDQYMESKRQVA